MDIPLGALNSKLYERNGKTYYKISPIFGFQTSILLDVPVSRLRVAGDVITCTFLGGFHKLRIEFRETPYAIYKVRIKPTFFWIIPFGIEFSEISNKNKKILFDAVLNSRAGQVSHQA